MSTDDNFDISGKINLSEDEVRRRILRTTEGREPHEIAGWSKPERDAMLRQLKEKEGLSIRQIERATGLSWCDSKKLTEKEHPLVSLLIERIVYDREDKGLKLDVLYK